MAPLRYLAAMARGGSAPPTPPPAHFLLLLLRHWPSRAKLCCFSANHDSRARTARRSDGPRRYKLASRKFNTFARWVFLRLPRSCRVADKSDSISAPDLQKIMKNQWFLSNFSTTRHDRAKRRKLDLANVSKRLSAANFLAPEHA